MRVKVRWRRVVSLLVGVVFLGSAVVRGQTVADDGLDLDPGARVRVTLAADSSSQDRGRRLVGRFSKLGPDSLSLEVDGSESLDFPRDAVVRLEKSVRPSRKGRGALIGFAVGFASVFTLYAISSEGECLRGGCGSVVFAASALLALPAAVVGAVVAPGEEWADVSLRRPLVPARTGLTLKVVPMVGRRNGVTVVGSF